MSDKSGIKNNTGIVLTPAEELQAVFDNMKIYQKDRKIEYDMNYEQYEYYPCNMPEYEAQLKIFEQDMNKILKICEHNLNDDMVSSILRDNLHIISSAPIYYPSDEEFRAIGNFMQQIEDQIKMTPQMSLENKIKIYDGLEQIPNQNYNKLGLKYSGLSYMDNIHRYFKTGRFTYSEEPNDPSETLKAIKLLNDNQANEGIKLKIATSAINSFPDNSTVYVNASNMLKETHKDDPLWAFSILSVCAPKEDSPMLIRKKYESDKTKLLDDVKSKISQSSKGEEYSPEVLGKRLYEYGFNAETKQFAQAVLENNKDNKELISAYNKARIKDKPLGNIRAAFTRKSKLEHL